MEQIYRYRELYLMYLRIGIMIGIVALECFKVGEIAIEREVVQAAMTGSTK